MYIDSHIHLYDEQYADDFPEVIGEALQAGVRLMIVPSVDLESARAINKLCQNYPCLVPAYGFHPHEAKKASESGWKELEDMVSEACAIGEIGLDYHYDFSPRDCQKEVLRQSLLFAKRLNKPVILHCREAEEDMLHILKETGLPEAGGVIHSCTAYWDTVKKYLDLGLHIGYTGMVTFPKLEYIRETAAKCPLRSLLIETDGPYLAPVPFRGRRCVPAHVIKTAECIADIRNMKTEAIGESSAAAAAELFRLKC